tara:strand:- start:8176 stop:9111 length:936 start_codon:yes stop_codon:yes gene_type:complete
MSENKRIDQPTGTETVGHEWDGIEELDTPMPRWWLWTFYATIVFSIGYVVVYPSIPGANGEPGGTANWSSRQDLERELDARADALKPVHTALATTDIGKLTAQPELMQQAIAGGAAAFKVHCVQCHGAGATGSKGYPNLNDDDWLWGGDIAAIEKTIIDGIRQPSHEGTRFSLMPAFGRDGLLTPAEIEDVTSYVRVIAGQEKGSVAAQRGKTVFETNCVVCHGPNGKGDRVQGAPNLTDAIWLYGGDRDTIKQTIANSRYGVMPSWGQRLDKATIRMLAAYVHSLGGGEATVAPQPVEAASAAGGADGGS